MVVRKNTFMEPDYRIGKRTDGDRLLFSIVEVYIDPASGDITAYFEDTILIDKGTVKELRDQWETVHNAFSSDIIDLDHLDEIEELQDLEEASDEDIDDDDVKKSMREERAWAGEQTNWKRHPE